MEQETEASQSPNVSSIQTEAYWLHDKLWENNWNGFTEEEVDRVIEFLHKLKQQ
jgi:hypothetical protein